MRTVPPIRRMSVVSARPQKGGDRRLASSGSVRPEVQDSFCLQPDSIIWLVHGNHDACGGSHMLTISSEPSPQSASMLADSTLPRGSVVARRPGYIVIGASHLPVTRNARPIRLLLAEQQVLSCPVQLPALHWSAFMSAAIGVLIESRQLLQRHQVAPLRPCCNAAWDVSLQQTVSCLPCACLPLPLSAPETKEASQGESCTSLQRSGLATAWSGQPSLSVSFRKRRPSGRGS